MIQTFKVFVCRCKNRRCDCDETSSEIHAETRHEAATKFLESEYGRYVIVQGPHGDRSEFSNSREGVFVT